MKVYIIFVQGAYGDDWALSEVFKTKKLALDYVKERKRTDKEEAEVAYYDIIMRKVQVE